MNLVHWHEKYRVNNAHVDQEQLMPIFKINAFYDAFVEHHKPQLLPAL